MAVDQKRNQHIEQVLATTRLAGQQPNTKFLELADQYRQGLISAEQVVAEMKKYYQGRCQP